MKLRNALIVASAAALVVLPTTAPLAAGGGWTSSPSTAASASCNSLNGFGTQTGVVTGGTNGQVGTFLPGDTVSLTVALGTATTSNVTIVGNGNGTPVLAGPLVGAGTISYNVTGALPSGSVGIGFFVNSTAPANGTVNVTISCKDAPVAPVPVWSSISMMTVTMGLLGFGLLRLRRRY